MTVVCLSVHPFVFVFIRQVAPVLACWLFKTSAVISCASVIPFCHLVAIYHSCIAEFDI